MGAHAHTRTQFALGKSQWPVLVACVGGLGPPKGVWGTAEVLNSGLCGSPHGDHEYSGEARHFAEWLHLMTVPEPTITARQLFLDVALWQLWPGSIPTFRCGFVTEFMQQLRVLHVNTKGKDGEPLMDNLPKVRGELLDLWWYASATAQDRQFIRTECFKNESGSLYIPQCGLQVRVMVTELVEPVLVL